MGDAFNLTRRGVMAAGGAGLAAAAAGGATMPSREFPTRADLLLTPGFVHLNTASLGPSSRAVLDATVAARRTLEWSPVYMDYGRFGEPDKVVVHADKCAPGPARCWDATPTKSC